MRHLNLCPHGLQAFDVLVHRTRPNGAAAGQRHLGMTKTRQQGPQGQHRGTHGFHQFIRRFGIAQAGSIQMHRTCVIALSCDTHVTDQLEHGGHVLQLRHIAQHNGLVGQQGCAQLRQSGIFGP